MCGRLVLADPVDVVAQLVGAAEVPESWPTRYNLAPTDAVPIVRHPGKLELVRWGLKMENPRAGGFNAKRESLRLYRHAKRCLVIASAFYEWGKVGRERQPHLIRRRDGLPLVLAGIVDDTDGAAIFTAPSSGVLAPLHDRMPVVLEPASFGGYLDPALDLAAFLASASADSLALYPVSRRVGNVRNDDASLIEPCVGVDTAVRKGETLPLFG